MKPNIVFGNAVAMTLGCVVYRKVLENSLADSHARMSANAIARGLGISPNTVDLAVRELSIIGAASISKRYFTLTDFKKTLMYWAAKRKLHRSIAYSTFVGIGAAAIESKMPIGIAFTAYSGYSALFGNDVSDYSEVHAYATDEALYEIERRFPKRKLSSKSDYADLVVLVPDKELEGRINDNKLKNSAVPLPQICVDLWGLGEWYAPRFFEKSLNRLLESGGKE